MASTRSFNRLAYNFGAQIYNQIVTIGVQIVLVPILLHAWGTERYGVWLLLSAIPTYLTFSDFGFTFIAKNEMTMKVAGGDRRGALVTYQSVFMLLNIIVAAVIAIAALAIFNLRLGAVFSLGTVSETTAKLVLFSLTLSVAFYQYFLLFSAGMRAEGKAAEETSWNACGRLSEGAVTVATALLGGDLLHAALAILANRIVFNFGLSLRLRNLAPYLQLGWLFCSRKEVKRLFNPSVSYMFVSIAQALTIQGPVVILGLIANPDQVVIFSTSRTLARLGTSASNILTFSVTPEYSRLFGLGEISRFLHIMRLHFALASAGTLIYTVFTRLTGGFILNYWTKGQVTIVEPFFTLLVLSVAAEMIWTTLFTPLAAINRHIIVSYSFAFLSIAGIGACYFLASAYGLIGIGIALLVIHLVMVVISSKEVISRKPSSVDEMFLDKH